MRVWIINFICGTLQMICKQKSWGCSTFVPVALYQYSKWNPLKYRTKFKIGFVPALK